MAQMTPLGVRRVKRRPPPTSAPWWPGGSDGGNITHGIHQPTDGHHELNNVCEQHTDIHGELSSQIMLPGRLSALGKYHVKGNHGDLEISHYRRTHHDLGNPRTLDENHSLSCQCDFKNYTPDRVMNSSEQCVPEYCRSKEVLRTLREHLSFPYKYLLYVKMLLILTILVATASSSEYQMHFTSSLYNASVPENALDSTAVISDEMMGMFLQDKNFSVRYRLAEGDPDNVFRVSSRVVGDFCFLELSVKTLSTHNLNRERKDLYALQIRAQHRRDDRTRMNIPGAITIVRVHITDLNDLSPLFSQPEYSIQISEDTPIYSSLIQVGAEDPDVGLNGEIYYSFREPSSVFCIHPSLGIVTLTQSLHFHQKSVYNLTLVAQDRGPQRKGEWPAVAKLTIKILEVNVFEPQIKVSHLEEMTPKGHLLIIAIVTVLDNDKGISGLVDSLEIVEGDPDRVFRILPSSENNEFSLSALGTINWVDMPQGYNLTLKATDRGTIPRFSYKDIYVAPPETSNSVSLFTQRNYEFSISEAAPPGSYIASLGTWIPGSRSREVYSISEDTNVHRFALESASGTLTTVRPLDAETVNSYSFKVLAQASSMIDQNSETVTIKINVLDANDNTPMIVAPQGVVQMDENKPKNTWIVKVRAQDYDFGKNGDVSYSLANGDEIPFTIDHFTGEVRTTKVIDYESERRIWKLLVRASDWGEPYRRQTEKVITIHVQDVNDNEPKFEKIDCSGYIDRSAPLGTEVFTLSAVDFDAGNIISYRILNGNEDRCFNLDTVKGVISLICDLQDMDANERLLNVTATDGLHFAESMVLRLQLVQPRDSTSSSPWADLKCKEMYVAQKLTMLMAQSAASNEANEDVSRLFAKPSYASNVHSPIIVNSPKEMRIPENSAIGSVILKLEAADSDSGYDGFIVYAITGGNFESVFRMDVNTGELKISGEIDRERTDKYMLNLTAYDLGVPQRFSSHVLGITILDENDNAPKFDRVAYSFFLPESVANGTNVYQLRANDPDEGRFGSITYHLATDTKDFSLNSATGQLSVSRQLDYETIDVYELRVIASDGGGLSAQTYVMVQVADVNDCAPKFSQIDEVAFMVPEDLPIGSLVTLINAYDADSNSLRYTIEDAASSVFSIDQDSGAVRLAQPLDYETLPILNISVRATDDGLPPLSTSTFLIIEVIDVNENVHSPVFGRDVAEASVLESAPPHTLVTSVPAVDGDMGPLDAAVSYSIVGDQGTGLFYIDQQGDIYTSGWLDRETTARYWLTIRATDSGTVPRHSTLHVYVEVTDVNDNLPRPGLPVYWPSIEENVPPNSLVVTLSAEDPDPDTQLSYAISAGNPQSLFSIDKVTGTLTTTGRKLDRELQAEHVLEVVIHDGPDPRVALSSSVMVVVKVLDQNDHSPTFLAESYDFTVPLVEGVSPWHDRARNQLEFIVGQVVAGDEDFGDNGAVTYRLMEESLWQGMFRVHPVTGVITMRDPSQAGKKYTLAVRGEDRGSSPRWNSVEVVVRVLSVSRTPSPPHLLAPASSLLSVSEEAPVGHVIHDIRASDDDGDQLWYSLLDGSSSGVLAVDSSGRILVAGKLDALRQLSYNVSVEVSDGHNKIVAQFVVTLVSANRHQPRFSMPVYEVEISEDTKPGTSLLTLAASDSDQETTLAYKLETTYHIDEVASFYVDSATGAIILATGLDREVRAQHLLMVSVTDQGSPTPKIDYCHVLVGVADHNDHAPHFALPEYNTSVPETAAVGSSVVQILASDGDSGANGHITYTIIAGNLGGALSIDPESGLVRLQRPLDRRQAGLVVVTVRASDGGAPPRHSHAVLRVAVTRPAAAGPRFLQSSAVFEVSEAARVGDCLGFLEVERPGGVAFTLFRGAEEGPNSRPPILVNPSSGAVILDAPLDYEQEQSFNLTVTAIAMSGESSKANIIITVMDENDHAPTFSQNMYWGQISEASPVGTVVIESPPPPGASSSYQEFFGSESEKTHPLVVTAQDLDADHNANLFFVIVESYARELFTIDPSTGAIRSARFLDHERRAWVRFSVAVRDGGNPSLAAAAAATVTVNITDVNDVPPKFLRQEYDATLWKPTQKGVMVAQLTATDEDFSNTAPLEYALVDGNEDNVFAIESSSGLVTVREVNNLKNYYKLKVTASDGQLSTSTSLNIRVAKLPQSGLRFTQDKYFGKVPEESTDVSRVAMVQALGSDLNEHLTYRLLTPTPFFSIGETSGVLQTTKQPFDRETEANYLLLVEVNSVRGTPRSRAAQVQVHVVVMDTNDHTPLFYRTPYYGLVQKSAKLGATVFKVEARDADEGDNARVQYEILDETLGSRYRDAGEGRSPRNRARSKADLTPHPARGGRKPIFVIDPQTGHITLVAPLYPQEEKYHLTVNAFDAGSPILSSKTSITLRVVDEYEPVFEQQHYSGTVDESAERGQPVLSVSARCPLEHTLLYTLSPQGPFDVDHDGGVVRVIDVLDYEETENYTVTVRATDTVTGHWVEVLVDLLVVDVNDHPPKFHHQYFNPKISEAASPGTSVLKILTKDSDTGKNAGVSYRIETLNGTVPLAFFIHSGSGLITLKKGLDREKEDRHVFVVIATDTGVPQLTATALVVVSVTDMNDNPPVFSAGVHSCEVSEGAVRGQFVTMVAATDADDDGAKPLKYVVVGGNDLQAFKMEQNTGILRVWNNDQLHSRSVHHLNVTVSDGVFSARTSLAVTVAPVNGHAPVFRALEHRVIVSENVPAGALVAHIVAQDSDRARYGEVTYRLFGDEANAAFVIDERTGIVRTRVLLDREGGRNPRLVTVAAADGGDRLGFTTLLVTINDDNDNSPVFDSLKYRALVSANASAGTIVLKVRASDKDAGENGTVVYRLHDSTSDLIRATVSVGPLSGELALLRDIHYMGPSTFEFTVEASDQGGVPRVPGGVLHPEGRVDAASRDNRKSSVPVIISIVKADVLLPRFHSSEFTFTVREDVQPGARIGSVVAHWPPPSSAPSAGGASAPLKSDLTYSINWGVEEATPPLDVSPQGVLFLASKLDAEASSELVLIVTAASKSAPELLISARVKIMVEDVNDDIPKFDSAEYRISLAENTPTGSSVIKVGGHDRDSGNNSDLRFLLLEGELPLEEQPQFAMDPYTGWLTLNTPLDAEDKREHSLKVEVRDSGRPSLSASTLITVTITDYNDNPPLFVDHDLEKVEVSEGAPIGTIITKIEVRDADTAFPYHHFFIVAGNGRQDLSITRFGELLVQKSLDRETVDRYQLQLAVTDGAFVSYTQMLVVVTDVNDNAPLCTTSHYQHTVSEAALPGTMLLRVAARDPDLSSSPRYTITGQGSNRFSVDATNGKLSILKRLDRERHSDYTIKVRIRDGGVPQWQCLSEVRILLSDVNDNPPRFLQPSYSASVAENSPGARLLTRVHADDPDSGINQRVSYFLVDTSSIISSTFSRTKDGLFELDSSTGILRVTRTLDREQQASYNLTIEARDHGTPAMSSRTAVIVLVSDMNDNPPEFPQLWYEVVVSESVPVGEEILRVTASSKDAGKNAALTYEIVGGNEQAKLEISPSTGTISVLETLNYERTRQYLLTVRATDGGTPPLSTDVAVNVTVTDVNDNAPLFVQSSYTALIAEDADVGERLIQVTATDQDSGRNGELLYGIMEGNSQDRFRIDPSTGWIAVHRALDREAEAEYKLLVAARDHGSPRRSGTVVVAVEIRDANDNPPLVHYPNRTLYLQEDRPVGVRLVRLKVTDADGDSGGNGGPFAFELLSGNTRGDFRITQNGDLLTAVTFAGQGLPAYRLQVRVHDNGRPHLHTDAWITVQVVEPSKYSPVVFPTNVVIMIPTDEYEGGSLGDVRASDQDPHDQLNYRLHEDATKSPVDAFRIDLEAGTLHGVKRLVEGQYSMNISVSDGKFTTYSTAKIHVINIEDEMIENGIIIVLGQTSPEEFLLSYRRSFLRSVGNIMDVNVDDVVILSIQPANRRIKRQEIINSYKTKAETYPEGRSSSDISVLFCVHRVGDRYYSRKDLYNKITSEVSLMESTMGLRVLRLEGNMCRNVSCINGHCEDVIDLEESQVVVTTEAMNFVSIRHVHEGVCVCPTGYTGKLCDEVLNECAYSPCPKYKECLPNDSERGFSCNCPHGFVGATCSKRISECVGYQHTPACYSPNNPIAFKGRSFTQYNIRTAIDTEFEFSTWFRTMQPSGNLMFISGRIDYSILEVHRGRIRYRWDLGSGEGASVVSSSPLLNDSNWHHVALKHNRNSAQIRVDNLYIADGTSPGDSEQLNLETSQMYLGAEVRPWEGEEDTHFDFVGCLDNPQFNHAALPVNEIMSTVTAALVRSYQIVPFCPDNLEPVGTCGSHPCLNGATCQAEEDGSYVCHCKTRFKGKQCEIDTDPCASTPCLNNGRCIQDGYSYKCQCPAHVAGNRCQYLFCSPNPCLNHGTCEEGIAAPICRCRGFKGIYCNEDINECDDSPCHEGGTCVNTYGGFNCFCPANSAGDYCSETRLLPLMPKIQEVATVVGVIVSLIVAGLLTLLAVHCRARRGASTPRRPPPQLGPPPTLKQNGADKHNLYTTEKINNLDRGMNSDGCPQALHSSSSTHPHSHCALPVETLDVTQIYDTSGDSHCMETPPQYSREYIVLGKLNTFNLNSLPPPNHVVDSVLGDSPGSPELACCPPPPHVQPPPAFAVNDSEYKYENSDVWTPASASARSSPQPCPPNQDADTPSIQSQPSSLSQPPLSQPSSSSQGSNFPSSSSSSPQSHRTYHTISRQSSLLPAQSSYASSTSTLQPKRVNSPLTDPGSTYSRHPTSTLSTFECRNVPKDRVSPAGERGSPRSDSQCIPGRSCGGVAPLHNPPDLVPANDPPPHAPSPGPLAPGAQMLSFGVNLRYQQAGEPHSENQDQSSCLQSERSNSLSASQTLCPTKLANEDNTKRFGTLPRSLGAVVNVSSSSPPCLPHHQPPTHAKQEVPEKEDKWRPAKKVDFVNPLPKIDGDLRTPEMISRV